MKSSDDLSRAERTPYNIRVDYRQSDVTFRERLGSLVPEELALRVEEVRRKRLMQEYEFNDFERRESDAM